MIEELKAIFSEFVPDFAECHARILLTLLSSELKSADEISFETRIRRDLVYKHLNFLLEEGLVKKNSGRPGSYFAENLVKALERIAVRKKAEFKKKICELKKLIESQCPESQEYLFKITENQAQLINKKTKQPIKDSYELTEIKRHLEEILRQCQPSRDYMMVYR